LQDVSQVRLSVGICSNYNDIKLVMSNMLLKLS